MTNSIDTLWQKLTQANVVTGDMPKSTNRSTPWYTAIFFAITGWLGAAFLLGHLWIVLYIAFESFPVALFSSLVMLGCAYFMLRHSHNLFVEHLALAISLAGQLLLAWSWYELTQLQMFWFGLAIFQLALAFIMPNVLHRLCSTVMAFAALASCLTLIGMPSLLVGLLIVPMSWLCINELRLMSLTHRVRGVVTGVVIATVLVSASHLFLTLFEYHIQPLSRGWALSSELFSYLLYIVAMVVSVGLLLAEYKIAMTSALGKKVVLFFSVFAVITCSAPGFGVGVMVILLGYLHRDRVLSGLGIASLLIYSFTYYYTLEQTLLFKSGLLLITALLMGLTYLMLNRGISTIEEH